MNIVYATTSTSVTLPSGIGVQIRWGEHWAADDPVVLAHPNLFTDDPTPGLRVSSSRRAEPPVEQATRAPGERRPTRRAG